MVKSLRAQCIELLTEIEARLDFDDEMPPLDTDLVISKINKMSEDVESALDTANYDKLLQSGLQVHYKNICFLLFMLKAFSLMFLTCIYLFSASKRREIKPLKCMDQSVEQNDDPSL